MAEAAYKVSWAELSKEQGLDYGLVADPEGKYRIPTMVNKLGDFYVANGTRSYNQSNRLAGQLGYSSYYWVAGLKHSRVPIVDPRDVSQRFRLIQASFDYVIKQIAGTTAPDGQHELGEIDQVAFYRDILAAQTDMAPADYEDAEMFFKSVAQPRMLAQNPDVMDAWAQATKLQTVSMHPERAEHTVVIDEAELLREALANYLESARRSRAITVIRNYNANELLKRNAAAQKRVEAHLGTLSIDIDEVTFRKLQVESQFVLFDVAPLNHIAYLWAENRFKPLSPDIYRQTLRWYEFKDRYYTTLTYPFKVLRDVTQDKLDNETFMGAICNEAEMQQARLDLEREDWSGEYNTLTGQWHGAIEATLEALHGRRIRQIHKAARELVTLVRFYGIADEEEQTAKWFSRSLWAKG